MNKSVIVQKENQSTGILLPKLFWPTVRKKCSSDQEKLLKSLEQFIQKLKGQNNSETEYFLNFLSMYWRFQSDMMLIGTINWIVETYRTHCLGMIYYVH